MVHRCYISFLFVLVFCMSCVWQLLNKRIYDDDDDDDPQNGDCIVTIDSVTSLQTSPHVLPKFLYFDLPLTCCRFVVDLLMSVAVNTLRCCEYVIGVWFATWQVVEQIRNWLRNTTVVAIIIPYPMAADFLYAYNTMAICKALRGSLMTSETSNKIKALITVDIMSNRHYRTAQKRVK